MDECPFCAIVAGERDAHVLHEDDTAVAFLDANPAAAGHTVVAPTAHAEDLLGLEESTYHAVTGTARSVADALGAALGPDGFSVFYTTGPLVGSVEHAHLHLLPRTEADDISLGLERGSIDDATASRLADAVQTRL